MPERPTKSIVFRAPVDLINEVESLACANFMDRTDFILASSVKLVEYYEIHGLIDKDDKLSCESEEQLALPAFLYSDEDDAYSLEEAAEDDAYILDDAEDSAYSLEAAEDDELPWGG